MFKSRGDFMSNFRLSLKEALRNGDAEAVYERGFECHILLPNEELTGEMIPSSPDWRWPSLVQGFALLFDGYNWGEEKGISPFSLLEKAEVGNNKALEGFTLTELRVVLFALQRAYRDAYGEPDPAFVQNLLDAIKQKVVSGLLE
jgi:hypothetical protein